MENPAGNIRRAVQYHIEGKYPSGQAPTDLYVPRDHIALQISAGTKNQAIGADPPKYSAMDVQVSVRIQKALCRECLSKM
jgi:hypothetical protein